MHCLNLPRTKILKWTHGTLMLALILHQFTKYRVACFTQAFQPPIIGDNVKTKKIIAKMSKYLPPILAYETFFSNTHTICTNDNEHIIIFYIPASGAPFPYLLMLTLDLPSKYLLEDHD